MHRKVSLSSPFRVVYMYMCFGTTHWDWSTLIITHHLHQATVAASPESTSLVFHLRKVNIPLASVSTWASAELSMAPGEMLWLV